MSERHNSRVRHALGISSTFIVKEKEQPVLSAYEKRIAGIVLAKIEERKRTSKASAKLISGQLRPRDPVLVIEETICCGRCRAIVFAEVTVKSIRAALGNQFDLAPAAAAFGRIRIGRHRTKLLDRVDRSIA